jgi:hypothetical protein
MLPAATSATPAIKTRLVLETASESPAANANGQSVAPADHGVADNRVAGKVLLGMLPAKIQLASTYRLSSVHGLHEVRVVKREHQSERRDLREQSRCERWVAATQDLKDQWNPDHTW